MSGLSESSEKTLSGKGFQCPNCGTPLELKLATTQSVTCHNCKSVIDVSQGVGADLAHYTQANSGHDGAEPQIPLGSSGKLALDGREQVWQVVGYQERCDIPEDDEEEQTYWREYLLYLPLYNGVSSVEIGLPKCSALAKAPPRPEGYERPIVVYGTSITQGGCDSRPGMVHTAILGRRLDRPVVNLGFSGNGKMEPELAALLAELDPAAYVIDCLPNMTAEEVGARVEPFVRALRAARPGTPIVLAEDRTYDLGGVFVHPTRRTIQAVSVNRDKVVWKVLDKSIKEDFDRLRRQAEGPREDAAPFGKESVGPDLRERRHRAGLTLSETARRAGIRQETLSRIENGRTNPTVGTVRAILRALEADEGATE